MNASRSLLLAASATLLAGSASAANIVVTDPTLGAAALFNTGSGGAATVGFSATNSTAMGTFTSLSGLRVVQNFAFSGNQSTSDSFIFRLTSADYADIRFTYSGDVAAAAVNVNNTSFATSSGSSLRIGATDSNLRTVSLRIDFGEYDNVSGVFTTGSVGSRALGFTLSGRFTEVPAVSVSYYSGATLLSSQVLTSASNTSAGSASAGYTGLGSASGSIITYAILTYTDTSATGNAPLFGLDDLAFGTAVAIPEPASATALAGVAFLGFAATRRRRR
jgi:hypothetical protein